MNTNHIENRKSIETYNLYQSFSSDSDLSKFFKNLNLFTAN